MPRRVPTAGVWQAVVFPDHDRFHAIDEQAAEATMMARIVDTSAVNVSPNLLRTEKFPLLFPMTMFRQSRVVLPRTKLPTCAVACLALAS